MRYLLLSSCLLWWMGCASVYKHLQPATGDVNYIEKFKPDFSEVVLYNTRVDVTGHHLSGLLLIKTMPDSSIRMVFSNEMGVKFFDFGFLTNGNFKIYAIIKQMDKKPVILALRKDFELVLMRKMVGSKVFLLKDTNAIHYIFPQVKGSNHYITNLAGDSLLRMEKSSNRKPVVVAVMQNYNNGIPDTIGIEHKNFTFNIGLKRISR